MSLDPVAPALRASDADREAVAEQLRVASVDGRIDSDELEQRLAAAYSVRWVADLDRLVADVVPPPPPPAVAPPYQPVTYVAETNGLAVASLVAGVMWIGWLGSFLAVIFGHIALGQIARSGGRQQGSGLAIGGLVLGYLGVATLALILLFAGFR